MASSQLLDTDQCTAVTTGTYDPLGSRGAQTPTISKVGGNKKFSLNQEINGYVWNQRSSLFTFLKIF